MATASIIPPKTFVEHANRLRARKLESIAAQVKQEMRIQLAPLPSPSPASAKKDIASVLKHFRGRLR